MTFPLAAHVRSGQKVTLSGDSSASAADISAPYSATAGYYFNQDGTVDAYSSPGTGRVQIDTITDWVVPRSAAVGSGYRVRCTVNSGSGPSSPYVANTWYTMSSDIYFLWTKTTIGLATANWTIEIIKLGGTNVLDSGTYISDIENGGA